MAVYRNPGSPWNDPSTRFAVDAGGCLSARHFLTMLTSLLAYLNVNVNIRILAFYSKGLAAPLQ